MGLEARMLGSAGTLYQDQGAESQEPMEGLCWACCLTFLMLSFLYLENDVQGTVVRIESYEWVRASNTEPGTC